MRALAAFLIFLAAACAPVTQEINTVTGTTLDERCATYEKALLAARLFGANSGTIDKIEASLALYGCPLVQPEGE